MLRNVWLVPAAGATVFLTILLFTLNAPPLTGSKLGSNGYTVGMNPKYVIAVDLNHDGILDIVTANFSSNTVSVVLGQARGTFGPAASFAVGTNPTSIAAADFNEDGNIDLVVSNVNNGCLGCSGVSLLTGNGDGTFKQQRPLFVDTFSAAVAAADLNGDGHVDLVVGDSQYTYVLAGRGNGTFAKAVAYPAGRCPHNIVIADFNLDGKLDIATANYNSNTVSVMLGNGDLTFQPIITYPVGIRPHDVISADLNGDGFPDLITANQNSNDLSILYGNGDGTFQSAISYPSSPNPSAVAAIDFNNDGRLDLVVTNSSCISDSSSCNYPASNAVLLLNAGGGILTPTITYSVGTGPDAIVSADFNSDGRPDLAVATLHNNTVQILLGSGDGTFH